MEENILDFLKINRHIRRIWQNQSGVNYGYVYGLTQTQFSMMVKASEYCGLESAGSQQNFCFVEFI